MPEPIALPEWATNEVNVVEPTGGRKAAGWEPSQRPPAGYFNWLGNVTYKWLEWLNAKAEIQAVGSMRPLRLASAPIAGDLVAVAAAPVGFIAAVGPSALIVCGDRQAISGTLLAQRTPGSSYAGDFVGVAWDPVLAAFAAVGTAEEIQTTTNMVAWTRRNTGSDTLNAVASNGLGTFVAVGDNGKVYNSTAVATWTLRTPAYTTDHNCVAYGGQVGSKMFVVGSDGGRIMTSLDGITWTERTSPTVGNIRRVEWLPSHGFVAWESGTTKLLHSADGVTWTADNTNHNVAVNSLLLLPHHVAFVSGVTAQFWDSYDADSRTTIFGGVTDLGAIHGCYYEPTQRQAFAVGNDGTNCFLLQSPFI